MNSGIEFEPVGHHHLALLRRWLGAPHVRQWWGDPDLELGYIVDMIEGRDTTRPFIFSVGGRPLGYIQYWYIGHHQNEPWITDNPWLLELPGDTIGVDLTIGEPDALSQGIGRSVLRTFVDRLRAEGHRTIIIDPDPHNARALRAYERAGFRPIERLIGRSGDSLIMQHHVDGSLATP